jgi:hypothetical protein
VLRTHPREQRGTARQRPGAGGGRACRRAKLAARVGVLLGRGKPELRLPALQLNGLGVERAAEPRQLRLQVSDPPAGISSICGLRASRKGHVHRPASTTRRSGF